jgi:C1A family cysteine protease
MFILSSVIVLPVNSIKITDNEKQSLPISDNSDDCQCNDTNSITDLLLDNGATPDEQPEIDDDLQLPSSWDWRDAEISTKDGEVAHGDWVKGAKDQKRLSCGSCWAFAACDALEARVRIVHEDPDYQFKFIIDGKTKYYYVDFSEQYLVSCVPGPFCEGCTRGASFFAYTFMIKPWLLTSPKPPGALLEKSMPYFGDHVQCVIQDPTNWKQQMISVHSFKYIVNPTNRFIKYELIKNGPVVSGITFYWDLYDWGTEVYDHPDDDPSYPICHEVVIIGYDDDEGCWICKNSWGTDWGENGFFRIKYGDSRIGDYVCYPKYEKGKKVFPIEKNMFQSFFSFGFLRNIINLLLFRSNILFNYDSNLLSSYECPCSKQ